MKTRIRVAIATCLLSLPLISGCTEDGTGDTGPDPARTGGLIKSSTPPASGANSLSPGTGSGVGTGSDVGTGSPSVGSDSTEEGPRTPANVAGAPK